MDQQMLQQGNADGTQPADQQRLRDGTGAGQQAGAGNGTVFADILTALNQRAGTGGGGKSLLGV
jgi:hypothetical protein